MASSNKRPPLSSPDGSRGVLHVRIVTGAGGGPDKTILRSPRYLREMGFSATCAYLRHPDNSQFAELERRAVQWEAPLVPVDDLGPLDWRLPGRLLELLAAYRPVIWHGHDYKSNLLGLLLRRSHPMRLVTTVHGWVSRTWKTPLYYAIDRFCVRRYDEVICVSRDLEAKCLRLGLPRQRCSYVPNAVDEAEFRRREPASSAKLRFGVSAERFVVGAVGRLAREKGFALLLRAAARLRSEGLDLEVWIAGEGEQRAELAALAADPLLEGRVKLLGFRSDAPDLYRAMDLFALSSLREGLPNVLLEAMATELPVVCSRVAGVPDLIQDGKNGVLVRPGSVDELAAAIKRLHGDAALRCRLGAEARRTVENRFTFGRRMEAIRAVYERACADSLT